MTGLPDPRADDRIFDRDRPEHTKRRSTFVTHIGKAAFTPNLRTSQQGKPWCKFVLIERGTSFDDQHGLEPPRNWIRKWGVYAFGDLARFAAESIRTGDRIIVYGFERGINRYIDQHGEAQVLHDITAWDLGQSMKVNHAFSERNGTARQTRNLVREEVGAPPLPDNSQWPAGPPPSDY